MEREVRDVLSALAGCVAMRYAAEKNLMVIADMERRQRAAWEVEFSSCAHAVAILPPARVSRRRARACCRSTSAVVHSISTGDGGGRDGGDSGGNREDGDTTKGNGSGTRSSCCGGCSCRAVNCTRETRHHQQQQQQHQQHCFPQDQRSEDKSIRVARAHSLGSAKFLFNHSFEHHNRRGPVVRGHGNESDLSAAGRGDLGRLFARAAGGGTQVASAYASNGSSSSCCSSGNKWGSENKTLRKSVSSPYKLAVDDAVQHAADNDFGYGEIYNFVAPTTVPLTDTHRCDSGRGPLRVAAGNNSRGKIKPVGREPLRRSTWLGPEVSPLHNNQDAQFTCPYHVLNFEAAAWPGPRRSSRWRGGNKDLNYWREAILDSSSSTECEPADGAQPQRRRVSAYHVSNGYEQNAANTDWTGHKPPEQQASGVQRVDQEWSCGDGGGNSTACSSSSDLRAAGRCDVEGRESALCACPAKTRGSSRPPPQRELYPAGMLVSLSSSAFFSGGRGDASERWQCDVTREQEGGKMLPLARPQHAEAGVGELRPVTHVQPMSGLDCSEQTQQIVDKNNGLSACPSNTSLVRVASQKASVPVPAPAQFGTEQSALQHSQNDDPEEKVDVRVDDAARNEPTTKEENDVCDSAPCRKPTSILPHTGGGGVGGLNSRSEAVEGIVDGCRTAPRLSATKGVPRSFMPKSHDSRDAFPRNGTKREAPDPTKDNNGALESAGGGELPLASSTMTIPEFQFSTPELVTTVLAVRDPINVRRQQQQQRNLPYHHHQQQQQQHLLEPPSQELQPQQQPFGQLPHRWKSTDDQDDQSDCTISHDKNTMLLTRRLKQLVQLESVTIQWERLPRREQEKLDRQQRIVSSRFRVAELARRDCSSSVSVVSAPGWASVYTRSDRGGGGADGGSHGSSDPATPSNSTSGLTGDGRILPPSDEAISSSIDLPSSSSGGEGDDGAQRLAKRAIGGDLGDAATVVRGRGINRQPINSIQGSSIITPQDRQRRRSAGGGVKRGGGGSCGVRDADVAIDSGIAQRGQLGDSSLVVVGIGSSITSGDQ